MIIIKKRIIGVLIASVLLSASMPLTAFSEQNKNSEFTQLSDTNLNDALKAGYTSEQYNSIMKIPKLDSVEPIPDIMRTASQQSQIVTEAKKYLGVPYLWGGSTPAGFDCSGFTQYVYKNAVNVSLPRITTQQETQGTEVSLNALQPGDLVFYGSRGNTYHVAIYIGNNQIIHSPQPGETVKIVNMAYFMPNFARRIVSGSTTTTNTRTPHNVVSFWYNKGTGSYNIVVNYLKSKNLKYREISTKRGTVLSVGPFNQNSSAKISLEKFLASKKCNYVVEMNGSGNAARQYNTNAITDRNHNVLTYWYSKNTTHYNKVIKYLKDNKLIYREIVSNGKVKIIVGGFNQGSAAKYKLTKFLGDAKLNYELEVRGTK